MTTAQQIYDELKDMDYLDYSEQYESDIAFIQSVIDQHGATAALDKLMDCFN